MEQDREGGISLDRSLLKIPLFGNIFCPNFFTAVCLVLSYGGIGLTENLNFVKEPSKTAFFGLLFVLPGF